MACASVVSPIEIFAADEVGRRRHWSDTDKVRIVEESLRVHLHCSVSRSPLCGSSTICVVEGQHSCPEQVWAGSTVHRALQGLQSVDLAFGLTIAPLHFDRIADRINIPVNGAGEPHDRCKVRFDRVVDPGRKRVCFSATQDTVEPHGEAAHRCEGGRASLERVDFPRLIRGQLSTGFDAQRGRDDRGDRVPRFRVPDRLQDLVLQGRALRLLFGSVPSGQEPLQI